MKIKAKRTFLHDQLGRIEKGAEIDVTPDQLRVLKKYGWVDEAKGKPAEPNRDYDTKVTRETPRRKAKDEGNAAD